MFLFAGYRRRRSLPGSTGTPRSFIPECVTLLFRVRTDLAHQLPEMHFCCMCSVSLPVINAVHRIPFPHKSGNPQFRFGRQSTASNLDKTADSLTLRKPLSRIAKFGLFGRSYRRMHLRFSRAHVSVIVDRHIIRQYRIVQLLDTFSGSLLMAITRVHIRLMNYKFRK